MKTNFAVTAVAALQDSAVIAVLHKSCKLPTPLLVTWLDFVLFKTPVQSKRCFFVTDMILSGPKIELYLNWCRAQRSGGGKPADWRRQT